MKLVAKYALYLFLTQFAIGFAEGLLTPSGARLASFFAGTAISLAASAAVFIALSARHPQGRWLRALGVLSVHSVLSLAVDQLMSIWLDSTPAVLVAVDWLAVVVGALMGTALGALFASRAPAVAVDASAAGP